MMEMIVDYTRPDKKDNTTQRPLLGMRYDRYSMLK